MKKEQYLELNKDVIKELTDSYIEEINTDLKSDGAYIQALVLNMKAGVATQVAKNLIDHFTEEGWAVKAHYSPKKSDSQLLKIKIY